MAERKKQRLSSEMLKRKRLGSGRKDAEGKRKSGTGPGEEIRKGITCGTAAGAKQGRTKGNGQQSRVREPGDNAWEIRREGTGKPKKRERRRRAGKQL